MTFELHVLSDTAYEDLIAEIIFADGSMVVVSQERDRTRFEISFYSPHKDSGEVGAPFLIDIDIFMSAIDLAKERLKLLDQPRQ